MAITTADYLIELYYSGAWHAVADGSVLEARGSWEIAGNRQNAVEGLQHCNAIKHALMV